MKSGRDTKKTEKDTGSGRRPADEFEEEGPLAEGDEYLEDYDGIFPEERTSQKAKARYSPYRSKGGRRTAKPRK